MIESECRSPLRAATVALSVPSSRIVAPWLSGKPLLGARAAFAPRSRSKRLLASETPLEKDR
jgi:hypothetical protein